MYHEYEKGKIDKSHGMYLDYHKTILKTVITMNVAHLRTFEHHILEIFFFLFIIYSNSHNKNISSNH